MLAAIASIFGSGGSSLIVLAVVGFVIAAGSFAEGYHISSDHAKAQQLDAQKAVVKAIAAEAEKYNVASTALEQEKAKQHVVVQRVTRTVDRIIDRPVYLNVCFDDDGVKAINDAITGADAPK